jgi:hypothetical protein
VSALESAAAAEPVTSALLVDVQRRLEALYAIEPQAPVTEFLIGEQDAAGLPGGGSRTLVRHEGDEIAVGVVLDGAVSARLSRLDPREKLDGSNLDAFCTLTEEVSHFVYLLFCAHSARTVTQLELELQGEVDKYLTVAFLLSQQNDGAVSARLRELLFRHYRLGAGLSAEQAQRYHAASELAYRYCGWLERTFLRRSSGLADLARESRRFYRLGQREKLERISQLQ